MRLAPPSPSTAESRDLRESCGYGCGLFSSGEEVREGGIELYVRQGSYNRRKPGL